jgi:hypothetical protein
MINYLNAHLQVINMAFILLKLKQNAEEPYAIYDLEKFGAWPFKKKHLIVGSILSNEKDITLIRTPKTRMKKFGKIIKTGDGWSYKFINRKKQMLEGIFRDGLKINILDNIIEFKEEL